MGSSSRTDKVLAQAWRFFAFITSSHCCAGRAVAKGCTIWAQRMLKERLLAYLKRFATKHCFLTQEPNIDMYSSPLCSLSADSWCIQSSFFAKQTGGLFLQSIVQMSPPCHFSVQRSGAPVCTWASQTMSVLCAYGRPSPKTLSLYTSGCTGIASDHLEVAVSYHAAAAACKVLVCSPEHTSASTDGLM